jgi:hypothetical protein
MVNGSLRGKQSASLAFLEDMALRLPHSEYDKTVLTVRARIKDSYPDDMLKSMACADAIIFVFPLHNYGLPGALMRLLEDYYQFIKAGNNSNKEARIYMIVNCAFPRPGKTTGEVIRVMQNFCKRLSLNWRFGICIGTGPVVVMTKRVPFLYRKLKNAYAEIASDILNEDTKSRNNYLIKPVIPAFIIAMIKKYYEKHGQMYDRN